MDIALLFKPAEFTAHSSVAEVRYPAEGGDAGEASTTLISKSSKSNKNKLCDSVTDVIVDDVINKFVCHFTLTSIGARPHDLAGSKSILDLCRCLVCR